MGTRKKQEELITPGDHLEWGWTKAQIDTLKVLYKSGASLSKMANTLDRSVTEIIVMIDQLLTDNAMHDLGRHLMLF